MISLYRFRETVLKMTINMIFIYVYVFQKKQHWYFENVTLCILKHSFEKFNL